MVKKNEIVASDAGNYSTGPVLPIDFWMLVGFGSVESIRSRFRRRWQALDGSGQDLTDVYHRAAWFEIG